MAKFIEYNILFHECAHILLGHSDTGGKNITEKIDATDGKKGYGHQAREFMADWYGIKKAMTVFILSFAKCSGFSVYNDEDLLLFRKIFIVCFLALFCQFDMFEVSQIYKEINKKENKDKSRVYVDEFSETELKMRTHPHPYVRLNYGLDALKEAMMDVIQMFNGVYSDTSERIVNNLLEVSLGDVFYFFEKMGLNAMRSNLLRPSIIESYVSIRKKASSPKHSATPYIDFKMEKMSEEYLDSLRKMKQKYFLLI